MTRGMSIMGIFCQNLHFSSVLVLWRAEVEVLTVYGANCKIGSNLM
jgi:hypothetical protein